MSAMAAAIGLGHAVFPIIGAVIGKKIGLIIGALAGAVVAIVTGGPRFALIDLFGVAVGVALCSGLFRN